MEISKTADSALHLLDTLGERGEASATELSRATGLNRTVAHRLLRTLQERGYVRREGDLYFLGLTLVRLATKVAPTLRAIAQPFLDELCSEVGESVILSIPNGSNAVVAATSVARHHLVRVEHSVGSEHSMRVAASGRALLAFQPEAEIKRVLRESPDAAELQELLRSIRETGLSFSQDELASGVHGLAVPVFDSFGHSFASLAVIAPVQRAHVLDSAHDPLLRTARTLSEKLLVAGVNG